MPTASTAAAEPVMRSSPHSPPWRLVAFDVTSAVVALALALVIYRGWRAGLWIHRPALPFDASLARFARVHALPAWVRNSLPDALWQYAFAAAMLAVWRGAPFTAPKVIFVTAPLAVGVLVELGQLARVFPGTFDPIDLLASLVAGALAFVVHGRPHLAKRSDSEYEKAVATADRIRSPARPHLRALRRT